MIDGLDRLLDGLARRGETMTYGAMARELVIPGPGAIARLALALEELMAQDCAEGRPLRAAACAGRLAGGLPAQGFFEAAERLGRFAPGSDPAVFVAGERAALFNDCRTG